MSFGAGSSLAGGVPAGFDPAGDVGSPRAVVPPQALFLDLATMDFTTDAAGLYQEVHPVDHKVLLALGLGLGSVPSSTALGSTLRDLRIGSRAQMTADATRIVKTALADLIAAGDVILVSVVAYASAPNRAHVEITYQNTRAPDADRNRTVVQ